MQIEEYVDALVKKNTRCKAPEIYALVVHDLRHAGFGEEEMKRAVEYLKEKMKGKEER